MSQGPAAADDACDGSESRKKRQIEQGKTRAAAAVSGAASLAAAAGVKGDAAARQAEAAEAELTRVLNKESFRGMRVIGQFNRGFIIGRLGADLFILDQHACDEKVRFETLQETTTIHEQPLIV
jgi:DNA mismatch repair protein PMS2